MAGELQLSHLIDIEQLTRSDILSLLATAESLLTNHQISAPMDSAPMRSHTLVNLFFENSTRTRISFELAAKRLGITTVNVNVNTTAIQKGETVLDTLQTLAAMHIQLFVMRHGQSRLFETLLPKLPDTCAVINAGDGVHAHPTQALLDLLTIQQHKPNLADLSVAIVGDILHSRVARSDVAGLQKLGVRDIRLVGPDLLLPDPARETRPVTYHQNLAAGLDGVDVVIALRLQRERFSPAIQFDETEYRKAFGLTPANFRAAKPDAILLHPGPVNHDIELTETLAQSPHSTIQQQVTNGIAIRMAVLLAFRGVLPALPR